MNPLVHIAVSCGVAYSVGSFFMSLPAFFITFMAGTLIDIDHFLDYFLNHSYHKLNFKDMYEKLERIELNKIYIIFHAYELVFCLWVLASFLNSNILLVAFATGYTVHLVLDHLVNPVTVTAYFLLYRIHKKFDRKYLIRGG